MTAATTERLAAAAVAYHLPVSQRKGEGSFLPVSDLIEETGMISGEIDAAMEFLIRNGVKIIRKGDAYQLDRTTKYRAERFARLHAAE